MLTHKSSEEGSTATSDAEQRDERYWSRRLSEMLDAAGAMRIDLNEPDVTALGDATEDARRAMIESDQPKTDLAATTERRWTPEELRNDFEVIGFLTPFVVARRRSDGAKGTLEFTHAPRTYFNWHEDGD
jgi:hypothetical protein